VGDFCQRCLRVVPLYLLGRSLQLDFGATYLAATRLFQTRNRIAHLGKVNDEENLLKLNDEGQKGSD
jgi:hypothetical protein